MVLFGCLRFSAHFFFVFPVFQSYGDVTIAGEVLQSLTKLGTHGHCNWAVKLAIPTVTRHIHLFCHLRGPVTLILVGECFIDLCLSWSGLEHPIFCIRGEGFYLLRHCHDLHGLNRFWCF